MAGESVVPRSGQREKPLTSSGKWSVNAVMRLNRPKRKKFVINMWLFDG